MNSIEFPPLTANGPAPHWDGIAFVVGSEKVPVLEYSENFEGWSDDLTALHEEATGDSHPIDVASRRYAVSQVRRYLEKAKPVILEIGCSSGFLIKDLLREFPEADIIGADVVRAPLFKLAEEVKGVPLIRFDLLQCPLPDESVDAIIMLNVLEHIKDDVTAIENASKLLRPGGLLILEVPAGPSLYGPYDAELNHFRRYTSKELSSKLRGAGLSVLRSSHLGFILYPAFAAVKLRDKWRTVTDAVRNQAKGTSKSNVVSLAMWAELKYLSSLELPVGIRALAVARKSV